MSNSKDKMNLHPFGCMSVIRNTIEKRRFVIRKKPNTDYILPLTLMCIIENLLYFIIKLALERLCAIWSSNTVIILVCIVKISS